MKQLAMKSVNSASTLRVCSALRLIRRRLETLSVKGGAVIHAITEETGVSINIEDDGSVTIASVDQAAADEAKADVLTKSR